MEFEDPVHGQVNFSEDVLVELIKTEPVQRLKHVNQAGPTPYFMDKAAVKRFDHSLGVAALLKSHGASIEEQIAGLLHDVPHTAFSHVADFVFENEEHEYHERFLEEIIYNSEIPEIVERHGLDMEYILDESNFGLLERELPDLCADRIDYFLRDMKRVMGKDIDDHLEHLTVHDGLFGLDDQEVAEKYALAYMEADRNLWADPKEVAMFEIFARAIRRAMDIGLLSEKDLFGTDEEVYRVLKSSDDPEIQGRLETLEGLRIELDPDDPDLMAETKVRLVDPIVVQDGETFRVSERSERVRRKIEEHKELVGSGYPVKILNK